MNPFEGGEKLHKEQPAYADVALDIGGGLDKSFQYAIPSHLAGKLSLGAKVAVPFGRGGGLREAYVVGFSHSPKVEAAKIKAIAGRPKGHMDAQESTLALAAWMQRRYGASLSAALKAVMPVKKAPPPPKPQWIEALGDGEALLARLGEAVRRKHMAKARLLEALLSSGRLPYAMAGDLGVGRSTLSALEAEGAIALRREEDVLPDLAALPAAPDLNPGQAAAAQRVLRDMAGGEAGIYLLYGVTGSGKTRVYLHLAREVAARGQGVIVLIPEISLSRQTLLQFYQIFGPRVGIMHSGLSQGEKSRLAQGVLEGRLQVVIGPRSALFSPFPRLGLIVIDEEHEGSYKSESMPKYHAREVAGYLAKRHGAALVLGSATPSMESYCAAASGRYALLSLEGRATGQALARTYVADMRRELARGNAGPLSEILQEKLRQRLERGEQSMLFLNRRGYSSHICCRSCGHVVKCPHCDVGLIRHKDGSLRCHYCGYGRPGLSACPQCGSVHIKGVWAGTQQVEEWLSSWFPGARILRMDGDTTRRKGEMEQILETFGRRDADILLGTQMIVKGHDFPGVSLVGILAADLSLAGGDYRGAERTFQLVAQAAGRAGRGDLAGEVVIQTYQPGHYAIQAAAAQDYATFYKQEFDYRRALGYPPAASMLAVQIFAHEAEAGMALAKEEAQAAGAWLAGSGEAWQLLGPAPAMHERIQDIFRFVFYVKSPKYGTLIGVKDILEGRFASTADLWTQFDFNPLGGF